MQVLNKRVMILLSDQERMLLVNLFPQFLEMIERQGASSPDLQVLLGLLKVSRESDKTKALIEALLTRITGILEAVVPDQLTLEEAEHIYGVRAATLRRACWSKKLPGEKVGGTWLVRSDDLEQYLAGTRIGTRRSR